jgi:pyruvate dehydrogenase E2 component (dihydrolipoamide acetyltransferase)
MAEIIRMPKMSDTMEEGVIASWLKKVGDVVKSGDILAEVETDKATMELESYDDGVLLYIGVKEKEAAPVDGVIAIIGEKGENIDDLIKSSKNSNDSAKAEEKPSKDSSSNETKEKIDVSDIKAEVITMPKMSDTMEEGTIAQWLKKVGDKVKAGDILAEVETDKATMELESYDDGILLYTAAKDGESVKVDGIIAIIGEKDADYKKLLAHHESNNSGAKEEKKTEESAPAPSSAPAASSTASSAASTSQSSSDSNGRVKASPLAKRIANEKGIQITAVSGSGEGGRIIKKDVENYVPSIATQQAKGAESGAGKPSIQLPTVHGEMSYQDTPVSQMRKTIAKRLVDSKNTAPHFYVTMEIVMDKAIEARASINEVAPVKISFNDFVIKACAAALKQHPIINSSWLGDKIRTNNHINIGVAVAVEDGLLVPVIRFADSKGLAHIATEVKELAGKAKNKKLQPSEWEGNTFTISNLGMFGVDEFTAIINPPDACILAVGGIKETAIVKDGQLVPGSIMKVTLSCDHRVVDGASAAAFLQTLKGLLENPVRIMI